MRPNFQTPVIGIAGWKKSGKTTLTVRLIEEFTRRGLKVASIKHAHHEFQVDDQQTDSARHRRAGAGEVVVVGGKRWAMIHELKDEPEPNLEEIFSWLSPSDLVIVEGYKTARIPKIEARRPAQQDRRPLALHDPTIIAIASDHETEHGELPLFSLDDISGIADFIDKAVGPLRPSAAAASHRENRPSDRRS
jgi:molybdopterin-guanine dinucleotide biosynthesis protein B